MSDGFLGRWSRRKQEVRQGKPLAEPAAPAVVPAPASPPMPAMPGSPMVARAGAAAPATAPLHAAEGDSAPLPSLDDVKALTPASDFTPFMARGVAPDVRNAAVKKLFADPHFNVMDRLDTYIDEYGQPDPIPAAMLRQMASAKFLKLFDDEEDKAAGDDADTPPAQDVAQSGLVPEIPGPPADAMPPGAAAASPEDAHTDLRLQPDHAPQRESAGPGPA